MSDIPQAPDWWQASDGKWYPPQAGQTAPDPFTQLQQGTTVPDSPAAPFSNLGYGQVNPARGCLSMWAVITLLTLLMGGAITAYVLFAVDDATDTIQDNFNGFDQNAVDAARVTDCSRGEFGYAQATVDVTNDGDEPATYFIEVTFESRNGNRQYGTGSATVTSLQPGRTTAADTVSAVEVPDGRYACRVTGAQRVPTP